MKTSQLRDVLRSASAMYRDGGNTEAADALDQITGLFAGREAMTVSAFAKLLASSVDTVEARPD